MIAALLLILSVVQMIPEFHMKYKRIVNLDQKYQYNNEYQRDNE